jgi:hypothetical protein
MPTDPAPAPGFDRGRVERSLLDPAWIAAIWRRRKWLGLAVVAVPLTMATGVVFFMPQIYEAKATVLVDRQQVPEHFVQPTVTSALDTRLQTISQVLAKHVDAFLVVVTAHRTPRRLLEAALAAVDPASILGLVFNGDDDSPTAQYGRYVRNGHGPNAAPGRGWRGSGPTVPRLVRRLRSTRYPETA